MAHVFAYDKKPHVFINEWLVCVKKKKGETRRRFRGRLKSQKEGERRPEGLGRGLEGGGKQLRRVS